MSCAVGINEPVPNTAHKGDLADLMAAVRALSPRIAERSSEIEDGRRVPLDLIEEMRRIGIFRMLAPRQYGGLDLDLVDTLPVLEELAIADSSAAWVAAIGCHGPLFFSLLSQETIATIYSGGADVIHGGASRPPGTAQAVPGGWRVSGRWGFASGCRHADWMTVFCYETRDGSPVLTSAGRPAVRAFVAPAETYRIIETWDAVGLCGTASHDIALEGAFIPDHASAAIALGTAGFARVSRALHLHMCTIAIGVAEGAIRDLVAAGNTRRAQAQSGLRESPVIQYELGRSEAALKAARTYLHAEAAAAPEGVAPEIVAADANSLQAAAWIGERCREVVDKCFVSAGTSAIHTKSPMQRRMRDVHTLTQHVSMNPRNYLAAGARRFGIEAHPLTLGI
jgi:alkylation response protein AidB-like acyl-CoA dehydrogenase